jgi:hypothetical protein
VAARPGGRDGLGLVADDDYSRFSARRLADVGYTGLKDLI